MTLLADLARAGFVLDADTHSSIVGPQPPRCGVDPPGCAADAPTASAPGTPSQDGPGAGRDSRADGPTTPAEMREECYGTNASARPSLCSRCERSATSVSRDGLCDACAELMLCIANDIERDGDAWWSEGAA